MNQIRPIELSLAYFKIENDHAVANPGTTKLGLVDAAHLRLVLEIFRHMNPVQDFTGEPRVIIAAQGGRWSVAQDLHRLIIYDLKHIEQPGEVRSTEQIVADMDESAGRERLIQDRAAEVQAELKADPTTAVEGALRVAASPMRLIMLSLVALTTTTAAVMMHLGSLRDTTPPSAIEVSAESQQLATRIVGTFMSGTQPGSHVIVVHADGTLRILEMRAHESPRFIDESFRLGRRDGRLFLVTKQTVGLIEVLDKDRLFYGGEHFLRDSLEGAAVSGRP